MSAGAETNFDAQEATSASRPDAAMLGAAGKLLAAYASLPGVMYGLKDASDGRYLAASESLAQFYGCPLDDVLGHNDTELLDPTLGAAMRAADQTALAHGRQLTSEHRFDWRDNKHDWEVLRLVTDLGGRRALACLWRDLAPQRLRESQLHAAIEQIEQHQIATQQLRREYGEQLMRDSATGLATRANFEDQFRREVDLSTREHREFAMVLLDLDHDSERVAALGSRAHDQVLEAMGRLLRGNTRAMDASCRLQGRRFAVLLSGVGLA
ncbi:MAG TPA: diguanylate cyclase, partial [Burkholderiaceae bacterium]